jgi:type IX secretion system PorP/SprF family membrane protein
MNILYSIRKEAIVGLILLFVAAGTYAQQGLNYTQYIDNQTPINATYSLLNPYGSINTMVRKQWVGIPGSPTTYLFNGSVPIESVNGSAGLVVQNDVFANENLTEFNAFFAKGIRLSENQNLAVSMSIGFRNYVANYSGIDASDPVFRNDVKETRPNLGFGVMYYTDNYYVGLSVPELSIRTLGTASIQDNSNFTNHYYFTAGFVSKVNDDYKFKYAALVSYSKDVPVVADISTILYMKNIVGFGVDYKTNNEVAGMFSVNYDVLHLGYSYQFGTTTSNVGGFSNATHEVTLGIRFGKKSRIGN